MRFDKQDAWVYRKAITATGTTDFSIDLTAGGLAGHAFAEDPGIWIQGMINDDFNNITNVTFLLQYYNGSAWVNMIGTTAIAQAKRGRRFFNHPWPNIAGMDKATKLRLRVTVSGTAPTAGRVTVAPTAGPGTQTEIADQKTAAPSSYAATT